MKYMLIVKKPRKRKEGSSFIDINSDKKARKIMKFLSQYFESVSLTYIKDE